MPETVAIGARAATHEASTAELVDRSLAGDRWAEDTLYRRHARAVFGLVTRLLGPSAVVEDVVQDAFVSALAQLDRLRDPAAFSAWLRRIAVDHVRRVIRRRSLQRRLGLLSADAEQGLAALQAPSAPPELRLALVQLDAALRSLPARLRLPWMLHRVEGLTLPDTADACGCSRATAARRLHDADQRLSRRGVARDMLVWGMR